MFKSVIGASLLAVGLAAPAVVHAQDGAHGAGVVVVSCYRGPLHAVIWDKPNDKFLDSLVAIGYSADKAEEIGMQVCRDKAMVGDAAALKTAMEGILRNAGPAN